MNAASPIERIAARGAPSPRGRRGLDAAAPACARFAGREGTARPARRELEIPRPRAHRDLSPSRRHPEARRMPPHSPRGSCRSANARRVVLADGRFAPGLSDFGTAAGLEILDLAALLERDRRRRSRCCARRAMTPMIAMRCSPMPLRRAVSCCASRPDARLRSRSTSCISRPLRARPCTRRAS